MIVKESAEDYLETVLILKNRKGTVRSADLAAELGVSKARRLHRNAQSAGGRVSFHESRL